VSCGWCGAPIPESASRRVHRVRCAECGAWSADPPPDEDELDRAYEGWYRPADGRFGGFGDALLRHTRGRLARRLDRIAPAGAMLDVGAGDGALLEALRARGRPATGIDRHPSHPGVRDEPLERVGRGWAGIVFWHSLEHLPDAGESLDLASSLLGPRGVLVIAMPNPVSLQAAAFGDSWFAIDYPRHLVHVPAPALLARLGALDLAVERVGYLRGGQVVFGWLHGLVGKLPGHPDLYDAIRRPAARRWPLSIPRRIATLIAAALLLPAAALAAATEAALRQGGTVYVEARRV
jgi:SAM-dependent methyltransferase